MSGKIIISGATSIIGKSLMSRLAEFDREAILISRNSHPSGDEVDAVNCQWDMQTEPIIDSKLSKVLQGSEDNILIHCAPIWLLTEHVKDLSQFGIKRVIAFSSSSIEGKSQSSSPKEQEIVELLSSAESALLSQTAHETKHKNLLLTIFRPTMIYGHGQGMNLAFIAKTIRRVGFFPLVTSANGLRVPVHANDLADAVYLSLDESKTYGKTYVLSGSQVMTYDAMVKKIFAALEKPVRMIKVPLFFYRLVIVLAIKLAKLPMDPAMANRMRQNLDFDSSAAKQDFSYSPGDFLPNGIDDILTKNNGRDAKT